MDQEIILRYLHFIAIFTIVGTLVSEYVLLKPELRREQIKLLSQIDAIYGLAALVLIGAGLTLWLGDIGKPSEFYTGNPIFLTKFGLYIALGLLSIYPTVFFLKHRKGNPEDVIGIPKSIFIFLRLELLILLIMPFLAGMMAKGIGY